MSTVAKRATMEDFLRAEAEAQEGTRLALIDGEIVEWGGNMTTRNSRHSTTMGLIVHALLIWLERNPAIVGIVPTGEARCRLRLDPGRIVGLDAAFSHRPSGDAVMFAAKQTLTAEPELPGFQTPVDTLFPKAPSKL